MARDTKTRRKEQKEFGQPELTLLRVGTGPDPRLVEMVRLLARRAATELYEQERKKRQTERS
ncbi:hypothetical protein CES85_5628 [Ochrobactrum quorumnocens]|uniref:Uncharacterized protein n=1 Tax=Ochrobactrum quorumnocens TaxID=271865 RepID=A0A248UDU0_9HYPH|nr:hypothetical protein [[Ochrobactrum] quorumnocens]ASV84824.1 hypothetical protein CES85_5628 [[Ochrobactrum] quorumnocens]